MHYRNIPKTLLFLLLCCPSMGLTGCSTAAQGDTGSFSPADYVNPFIGASTSTSAAGVYHGLGKTFPGATTPYGMVQVSPNTITGGDNSPGYSYEHTTIEGFALGKGEAQDAAVRGRRTFGTDAVVGQQGAVIPRARGFRGLVVMGTVTSDRAVLPARDLLQRAGRRHDQQVAQVAEPAHAAHLRARGITAPC